MSHFILNDKCIVQTLCAICFMDTKERLDNVHRLHVYCMRACVRVRLCNTENE